ncbi:metal-dependent hydrolase [Uliginosibacterium sp. H3]|uniref:Metal-dependent hydrolase n=1 Tax=Uliginosibacterium silvisoli TaxID=3114758 RepID=A0ABU6JY92_9RHOO|nr:metal-dependent hydrolase [Uliginosibacterium sp. H3]
MPTILTHPAVPLAIGIGLGTGVISPRLLLAGAVASIVPDLDVISFHFGIAYGSELGHRGFSHSLVFALLVATFGALAWRTLRSRPLTALLFLFVAMASHGVLDSFTNGGRGIAFLWPFSAERFFAPYQVIEVSPIGAAGLFTTRGARVLMSELLWVWLPCALFALALWDTRRSLRRTPDVSAGRLP